MKIRFTLVFILISIISIHSQIIGIAPTKIWTDNSEIQNPFGYSLMYIQKMGRLELKLETVSGETSRRYYGILNSGFLLNPEDYVMEEISTKSTYKSIAFSFVYSEIFSVLDNQFNAGLGISFDRFSRDKTGLNSNQTFGTDESKFGIFYSISLSHQNVFSLPIRLEILFKHKALWEGNYATDIEQPFTGAMDVKELQFIIAYMF